MGIPQLGYEMFIDVPLDANERESRREGEKGRMINSRDARTVAYRTTAAR
jgi:hypothetical protein